MNIFNIFKKEKGDSASVNSEVEQPQSSNSSSTSVKEEIKEESKETLRCETPKPEKEKGEGEAVNVYNLIILDESGSMYSIYQPALTGVNETLQTIRMAKDNHPEQTHFVTLVTFDTAQYNRIYNNTPAEKAIDITPEQYRPGGGTPLFDAMGIGISELRSHVKENDVVLVTVITDGYENASREYSGAAIKSLVKEMRAKGWVFTYIGANQDVDQVADSMAINNRMAFDANAEGTKAMFAKEKAARSKFFSKVKNRNNMSKQELESDFF